MKWHVGEIAEMIWDMTEEGLPVWATRTSVKVVAVGSKRVTVVGSPETERAGAIGKGIAQIMRIFQVIEWHFDPETGEQLPETKYIYKAKLIKLKQTQN